MMMVVAVKVAVARLTTLAEAVAVAAVGEAATVVGDEAAAAAAMQMVIVEFEESWEMLLTAEKSKCLGVRRR